MRPPRATFFRLLQLTLVRWSSSRGDYAPTGTANHSRAVCQPYPGCAAPDVPRTLCPYAFFGEMCQLIRASAAPKRAKSKHGASALPWLLSPPMEYTHDASSGVRLTLPRPLDEAKANAARSVAVQAKLHIKKPEPKGDAKGGKDAGGKKKK